MEKNPAARIIPGVILFLLIVAAVSLAGAVTVKGTISVTSEPRGADIYLNDEYLGLQTNTVIENVFPGIHYVRLELAGYRTWEQIFEVREGEITYISHEMEPLVGDTFSVSTDPEGAQIFIDGEFYGISDAVIDELPTGQHTVLLKHGDYADYTAIVTITEGMPQSLVHTFEPIPTTGQISVVSIPPDAEVFLNEEFEGTTSMTLDEVVPGTYGLVIKKTGYDDWTGRVDVAAGKISEVQAELTPAKVIISVATVPEDAGVFVDGNYFGTAPLEITVRQGVHTILIEKFGYASSEREEDVGAEGATFLFTLVSMAPQAIEEAERVVSENLEYNPKKAQAALENAIKRYGEGDSEGAIQYAETAIAFAVDVDGDGVSNSWDISPHLNNTVIYVSPFILLFLGIGFLIKDISRHRVKPEITVNLPVTIREDDMLAQAEVMTGAPGGPYRGFVCTISIDGVSVEHFTDPGTYGVTLSGRSRGVHRFTVHLQVVKERYGRAGKKVEKTFIVEPVERRHPVPDQKDDGDGTVIPENGCSEIESLYEKKRTDDTSTGGDSEQ